METNMLVALLERIKDGRGDSVLYDQFQRLIDFNRGKGFCGLINMPGPPLISAQRLFRGDFDHHLKYGTCALNHQA
jgi:NADH:ubiquinone oxidoreductase subunit F (NADH-binding)